ncbi:MAG: hypothetical protein M3340_12580 [Actinomycetota bacterium]|nr:hypothetical protein [Actinomycetota bacterium]
MAPGGEAPRGLEALARRPLLGAVLLAAVYGVVLMIALAVGPVVRVRPAEFGFAAIERTLAEALRIWAANVAVLLAFAAVPLLLRVRALSQEYEPRRVSRELLALLGLVALAFYLNFAPGVEALAESEGTTRVYLLTVMIHGYLEFPALFLPWTACAVEQRLPRRSPRLLVAAMAVAVVLLGAGAAVEALVSPELLDRAG